MLEAVAPFGGLSRGIDKVKDNRLMVFFLKGGGKVWINKVDMGKVTNPLKSQSSLGESQGH